MKHYEEILITIGASNIKLVEAEPNWEFYYAEFQTPISTTAGNFLFLKHKFSLKEVNSKIIDLWNSLSGGNEYNLITTPKSPLNKNLQRHRFKFGAKSAKTTTEFLKDYFLRDLTLKAVDAEQYFIDPDLKLENEESVHDATEYLGKWLLEGDSSSKPLSVLIANGGVGKTTVSRMLCNQISKKDRSAFPILIESEQWKHLIQSSLTIDKLWDEAILRRFEKPTKLLANKTALRVLIQEGLFIIIFDGFDELCVTGFSPQDIIDELMNLSVPEDGVMQAKILITSRETFWKSIQDEIDTRKMNVFELRGFDNDKRKRYFERRLKDPVERDIALRITRDISGKQFETIEVEKVNEERPSGVPFVLDLIAQYVQDNKDENLQFFGEDHLEVLLDGICKRENKRQTLGIDSEKQLLFFEELFRDYQNNISLEDLKLYLDGICEIKDLEVVKRFTSHPFLQRIDNNNYCPRYEVLRVYFVARFIANGLLDITQKKHATERVKIIKKLAENSLGKTQVMDWLIRKMQKIEENRLAEAIGYGLGLLKQNKEIEYSKGASLAIFHLILSLVEDKSDKSERTRVLTLYLQAKRNDQMFQIQNKSFTGLLKSFDFSNYSFNECTFVDVEFKNCNFSAKTNISKSSFEKNLKFTNCNYEEEINFINCTTSNIAEFEINRIKKIVTSTKIKMEFAEESLTRALKKFKRDFGYISIQYRYRTSGFNIGNPYRDKIWELLEKHSIVERHTITQVEGGGLKIKDDKDLKKEILSYLDNAVLSKRLNRIIEELIN